MHNQLLIFFLLTFFITLTNGQYNLGPFVNNRARAGLNGYLWKPIELNRNEETNHYQRKYEKREWLGLTDIQRLVRAPMFYDLINKDKKNKNF
jgi:hypothetical protein